MNNSTVICQEHFRKEDITVSLVTKKWTLIIDWSSKKSMRKYPRKRLAFTSPPVKVAKLDTIDDESEYIYTCTPLDMPVPMKDPDVHIDVSISCTKRV